MPAPSQQQKSSPPSSQTNSISTTGTAAAPKSIDNSATSAIVNEEKADINDAILPKYSSKSAYDATTGTVADSTATKPPPALRSADAYVNVGAKHSTRVASAAAATVTTCMDMIDFSDVSSDSNPTAVVVSHVKKPSRRRKWCTHRENLHDTSSGSAEAPVSTRSFEAPECVGAGTSTRTTTYIILNAQYTTGDDYGTYKYEYNYLVVVLLLVSTTTTNGTEASITSNHDISNINNNRRTEKHRTSPTSLCFFAQENVDEQTARITFI